MSATLRARAETAIVAADKLLSVGVGGKTKYLFTIRSFEAAQNRWGGFGAAPHGIVTAASTFEAEATVARRYGVPLIHVKVTHSDGREVERGVK